uniref:Histone-lysine N-methyltransferase EZA1 n=1 Tax=Cajanus cajan TaxID=3821 RepID=A0A151T9Q5_CAJCA|nr:Histone-lysine N-methyltransferase EZA1 [Cajanus cajan]
MVEKDRINNVDLSLAKGNRIPHKEKLPPYTSWVYVARNEKMAEDQSVIGKYQMYYDKNKGEMVICSDSEEEIEEVKHDFTEIEDQILRMTLEDYESTRKVLGVVKESIKTTDSQIQERYEKLKEKNNEILDQNTEPCDCKGCESHIGICLEKSLSDNLENYDILFCRQCYIFDCPVHGTNQPLIYPSEKQPIWFEPEGSRKPCSDQCYLLQARAKEEYRIFTCFQFQKICLFNQNKGVVDGQKDLTNEIQANQLSNSMEMQVDETTNNSNWKPLEIDLYLKGLELFGKNSCLIARILLSDLKTCLEVARYMFSGGESMPHGSIPSSMMDINEKINAESSDKEMASKSKSQRKKGKPRKFNYSRKSAGLPPRLRKIAYGESLCNKQYSPCGCHGMCGKECPCLLNGTCCEKYCGCFKLCNNRFRGCYCAKSQCKSRLCPCFAANRECDPDVCRNCWVSCGDGSLGEPPRCGDGQCGNMNILLGQKQRILLGKSDVAGWGAFTKNPIKKNACLGEYTGELITQKEADKRGKLYHRINISFLFNLNDQASWVIDACRFGDKLKFANHSSKPNCYAKVMLVGGDHRVGIFAKENIEAGDEIFYDYYYALESAPAWALPSKDETSKKDEVASSRGKAKKHHCR